MHSETLLSVLERRSANAAALARIRLTNAAGGLEMRPVNAAAKLETISATPLRGYCSAVSRDARKYLPTVRQAARSNL